MSTPKKQNLFMDPEGISPLRQQSCQETEEVFDFFIALDKLWDESASVGSFNYFHSVLGVYEA